MEPLSQQPALGRDGRRGLCLWGGTGTVVLSTGSWDSGSLWGGVHGTGRAGTATLVACCETSAPGWALTSGHCSARSTYHEAEPSGSSAAGGRRKRGTALHCTGRNRDSPLKAERLSCSGAMCLQLCVLLEVTIWMARKSHLHPNGELDKPQQE